jgi:hypothetical protein
MSEGSRRGPAASRRAPRLAPTWLPLSLAGLATAALAAGVWWASPESSFPNRAGAPMNTVARVRALSPTSGCLLTDPGGVTRAPASEVWAGLQDAGAATKSRVSFLPLVAKVPARDQLNALIAQRCNVVLAIGQNAITTVRAAVGQEPSSVRFAVAGDAAGKVSGFDPTRAGARSVAAKLLAEAAS